MMMTSSTSKSTRLELIALIADSVRQTTLANEFEDFISQPDGHADSTNRYDVRHNVIRRKHPRRPATKRNILRIAMYELNRAPKPTPLEWEELIESKMAVQHFFDMALYQLLQQRLHDE